MAACESLWLGAGATFLAEPAPLTPATGVPSLSGELPLSAKCGRAVIMLPLHFMFVSFNKPGVQH